MRYLYITITLLAINVPIWSQHTISYTYDQQGRLTEEHYQDIYKASFSYDVEGNLELKVCEHFIPVSSKSAGGLSLDDSQVKLYPNPATGIMNIELEEDAAGTFLQVYSSTGRLIFSRTLTDSRTSIDSRTILDLGEHKSGLYLFRFSGNSHNQTIKVILDSE